MPVLSANIQWLSLFYLVFYPTECALHIKEIIYFRVAPTAHSKLLLSPNFGIMDVLMTAFFDVIMCNFVFLTGILAPWHALLCIIAAPSWQTECFQHVMTLKLNEWFYKVLWRMIYMLIMLSNLHWIILPFRWIKW